MQLEAGARTDTGRMRTKNEDAVHVDAEGGLLVVADGLGGHQAGEVASSLAVEEIRKYLEERGETEPSLGLLTEAVQVANQVVYQQARETAALFGMGTTVVVAVIKGTRLLVAHVGDSRAYLLREEGLVRLTDDHTPVFQMITNGLLSEEDALVHPSRGLLLRSLGIEPAVEVDEEELDYHGETVLLCTDGLTDMLRDSEIEEILRANPSPKTACDRLVQAANERGGRDNITVVVARPKR